MKLLIILLLIMPPLFADDDEHEYQKEVWSSKSSELQDTQQEKKKTKNVNGNTVYPRNPSHAKKSILDANFSCEISSDHKTFIQKFNLKPFTEAHHLIPLRCHSEFQVSLDVPANIISLCPNCHRKLHFGQLEKIEDLLKLLLEKRTKRLSKCGIKVSVNKITPEIKNQIKTTEIAKTFGIDLLINLAVPA